MNRILTLISNFFLFTLSAHATTSRPNYADALQKSIYFYEVQRSGKLPLNNRVTWRGDSGLLDGALEGIDLEGGWHDAGDHVKFGFPAASAATLLAWSLIEDEESYRKTNQYLYALANLRWINDYFIKAHSSTRTLWGQVGEGGIDHAYWGPPEVMQMPRRAFKIDENCPGSDLAGETAAAMAAAAMSFKEVDPDYAQKLIKHSEELYDFSFTFRGFYTDCIRDAASFYKSNGFLDELIWSGIWLYRATGKRFYLDNSESLFDQLKLNGRFPLKWTHSWDDKTYGSYVLLYQLTKNKKYKTAIDDWLDYWTIGGPEGRVPYTPSGLAWLDMWGSLRYASNTAMLAIFYSRLIQEEDATRAERLLKFGESQINYILGKNPLGISFLVGYGHKFPLNPHHRSAHGSWNNNISTPKTNRHTLYGALVGGPDLFDNYLDDRSDYVKNEVAIDYNSGFQGALAALLKESDSMPDPDFPVHESVDDEFFSSAKINAKGPNFFEVALKLHNHSSWPARTPKIIYSRYYFTLGERMENEDCKDKIQISANYNQGVILSELRIMDLSRAIYYIEADFSKTYLSPSGESESQKEVQLRVTLPSECGKWDLTDDWSYTDLQDSNFTKTPKIPVFEGHKLVFGQTP